MSWLLKKVPKESILIAKEKNVEQKMRTETKQNDIMRCKRLVITSLTLKLNKQCENAK